MIARDLRNTNRGQTLILEDGRQRVIGAVVHSHFGYVRVYEQDAPGVAPIVLTNATPVEVTA